MYVQQTRLPGSAPSADAGAGAEVGTPWPDQRGQFAAFPALARYFTQALQNHGRDTVLRAALPTLLEGVAAAAFHGAIRTAHAVRSGHTGELAAALAYWAARWMPLPFPLVSPAARPAQATGGANEAQPSAIEAVTNWWSTLDAAALADDALQPPPNGMISARMRTLVDRPAYGAHAGRLQIAAHDLPHLLRALAHAAAARYAVTGDFTVLHLATGTWAVQSLAPWLPPEPAASETALAAFWPTVAAGLLASGTARQAVADRHKPQPAPPEQPADWPALCARACASDDDHVIKLVHVMAAQAAGDAPNAPGPWRAAALTALRG